MRIVCPSCQAVYDVPDALLASGQGRPAKVRCARCATEWVPAPPDAAPAPPVAPEPEPAPHAGPTPSAFADAIAQANAARAAPPPPAPVPPPPEPPAPPPPPKPVAAPPRPLAIDRTPPRPAGETLVAEHLATGRDAQARSPRDAATLLFAWSLSIGVVLALLIAALLHRAEVVAFWPPAARAYDLLGLK